jgi:nanoRNase/pAp phosphatase (c-di-AMP/oligoRNAs hydrolase)
MFSQDKIQKLSQILNQNKSFAIFMHENPDWDTIGSALAVWRILEKLWKKVDYFCPSKPSKKFYYLEEVKKIQTEFDFADYDEEFFGISIDSDNTGRNGWYIDLICSESRGDDCGQAGADYQE